MSDLPSYAVMFRGKPACPCQVAWLPVFEVELQRRGLLTGSLTIYQLIGGAAASGGTHADGGASDLGISAEDAIRVARDMGADATWYRPPNWDGAGGMAHTHSVLRGCPHNGPARYQIAAVDDGFNGLGAGGRGAVDPGPRPLSGRTWREGIKWAKEQQREAWFEMASEQDLRKVVREEVTKPLKEVAKRIAANQRARVDAYNDETQAQLDALEAAVSDDATKRQIRGLRERLGTLVRDLEADTTTEPTN